MAVIRRKGEKEMDVKTLMCIIMAVVAIVSVVTAVGYAHKYKDELVWRGRAMQQMSRKQMTYCVNCKHHLKMTKRIGDKDIDTVVCRLKAECDKFEERDIEPAKEEQAVKEYLKARDEAFKEINARQDLSGNLI